MTTNEQEFIFTPRIEGDRKLTIDPDTLQLQIFWSDSIMLEYDCENIAEAKHLYDTLNFNDYDNIDLDAYITDEKIKRHMHNFYDATNAQEIEYAFLKVEKLLDDRIAILCLDKYICEKPEVCLNALSGLESTNIAAKTAREELIEHGLRFNAKDAKNYLKEQAILIKSFTDDIQLADCIEFAKERTLESFLKIKEKKQLANNEKPQDEQFKKLEKKYEQMKSLLDYANTMHTNQTKEIKELREENQELKSSIDKKALEKSQQTIDEMAKLYKDSKEHLQEELEALKKANTELKNNKVGNGISAENIERFCRAIEVYEKLNLPQSTQSVKEAFEKAPKETVGGMFSNKKEVYIFTQDEAQKLIKSVEENDTKTLSIFDNFTNGIKTKAYELIEGAKNSVKQFFEQKQSDVSNVITQVQEQREKPREQQNKSLTQAKNIGR